MKQIIFPTLKKANDRRRYSTIGLTGGFTGFNPEDTLIAIH